MGRVLDHIMAEPWAIQEEALSTILAIAQRVNESPEAVAAKLGRPLENTRTVQMRSGTAVIPVTGPIFRYANLFTEISGATSLEILAQDLNAALADPAVRDIVLEIDSPGGQANGISEFADMVRAADKPVTAYVGGIGASAAYWIAAAADTMVVSDTALLGSIGVVSSYRVSEDGEIKVISSQSPLKQASPETADGRKEVQRVVDDMAAVFVSAVARNRGVSEETVLEQFGRGGLLVGQKAVAAGMADRIGSLESVIAGASGNHQKEVTTMADQQSPEITREYLAANHPGIVEDIKTEGYGLGHADGKTEGAEAERKRIQAVEAQVIPGHEKLIESLKFDGTTTGPEAAVQVLAAEKQKRVDYRADVEDETPPPLPPVVGDDGASAVDNSLPVETRCEQQWEKDPAIRKEFGALDTFIAYTRAEESGRVRRIGGNK